MHLALRFSKYLAYIAGGSGADGWRSIGALNAKSRRLPCLHSNHLRSQCPDSVEREASKLISAHSCAPIFSLTLQCHFSAYPAVAFFFGSPAMIILLCAPAVPFFRLPRYFRLPWCAIILPSLTLVCLLSCFALTLPCLFSFTLRCHFFAFNTAKPVNPWLKRKMIAPAIGFG